MIAVQKRAASVADTAGGNLEGLEENEGRIVQLWVHYKGGLQNRCSLLLAFRMLDDEK